MTKHAFLLGLIGLMASPYSGYAAVDGNTGQTSQGALRITLTVDHRVRLSKLQDLQLNTEPDQDSIAISPACIYASSAGNYELRASGSGAGQAFALSHGTDIVPYQVLFDDGSGMQPLNAGAVLTGLQGGDSQSPTCGITGDNGRVAVVVPGTATANLLPGHYAGTLTLVVAPD